MIVCLYFLVALVASVLGYFFIDEKMNIYYMASCSWAMAIGAVGFVGYMRFKSRDFSYLSASSLFVLGFGLVHFFYGAILLIEEEIQYLSFLWRYPKSANYTILIGVVAFSLFIFGYLSLTLKKARVIPTRIASVSEANLSRLLLIAPIVSIVNFAMFLAVVGPTYLSGAYAGSSNWRGGGTYYFLFFEIFFYLTLTLEVYKIRLRAKGREWGVLKYAFSFNIVTLALLFFYIVFNAYIGDRGPILTTLFIVVGGYDFFIKRFKLITVLAALLFGMFTMSFIADYRTRDASMTFEQRMDKGLFRMGDRKWYAAPGELGGSVRILNTAIVYAESDGLWWGKFQTVYILGLVPMAKSFVAYTLRLPFGMTSSFYFTQIINGVGSAVGAGTTIVADIYMDWGVTGVVVLFFVLGRFMAWIESNVAHSTSLYLNCLYLLVLSNALYWGRSALLAEINTWAWSLLILWASHRFLLGHRFIMERRAKRSFLG